MSIQTQAIESQLPTDASELRDAAVAMLKALYKISMTVEEVNNFPTTVIRSTIKGQIEEALKSVDSICGIAERHQDNTKPLPRKQPSNMDATDYINGLITKVD